MASWVLIPCLEKLRSEFNELRPDRDKSSDGSVGDEAHSGSSSDHNPDETGNTPYEDSDNINEVHAIDVDDSLNPDGEGLMEKILQERILPRCRSGAEQRLQNIIYERRIWSDSSGWKQQSYSGSNPHDKHAHFSAKYATNLENDTSTWGFLDIEEWDMTDDDMKKLAGKIADAIMAETVKVGDEQWTYGNAVGYIARKAYEVDATLDGVVAGDKAT